MRTALAMGADRAILVQTDEELQPLAVAKLLKAVLDKELPGLRFFYGRIGDMTVAQLAERSHGKVDEAKLKSIQAGFDHIR